MLGHPSDSLAPLDRFSRNTRHVFHRELTSNAFSGIVVHV